MITENYVSLEIAKLLKEKGFECAKESITAMYDETGRFCSLSSSSEEYYDYDDFDDKDFIAPTFQMVMKWFREFGLHLQVDIEVDYDEDERGTKWYHQPAWCWVVFRIDERKQLSDDGDLYATYEKACETGIKYCLENLI
jgi:hypothetical protein